MCEEILLNGARAEEKEAAAAAGGGPRNKENKSIREEALIGVEEEGSGLQTIGRRGSVLLGASVASGCGGAGYEGDGVKLTKDCWNLI